MIIKKIAFGNFKESFIEEQLEDKVNIIFSNDNNKGKTLLIQGLLYSMGNMPVFPSGFDYQNHYFYSMIEISGKTYEFVRKNKTTIIKDNSGIRITESLSELKYVINKVLFELPVIEKNGEDKVVDLYLFYQLFFIGQDKRNTSSIVNSGQYNKRDFLSMLASLNGAKQSFLDNDDIELARNKIKDLKTQLQLLNKKLKFIAKNPGISKYSITVADQDIYNQFRKKLIKINSTISNYGNQRTRETNRQLKLGNLLTELNSLNQKIEIGKVKCGECGSDKIIYTNGDMSFEVSNSSVRKNIINSIKEQIQEKSDTIEELSTYIRVETERQTGLMKEIPPEMRDIIAFSDEILSLEEYSAKKLTLQEKIQSLQNELKQKSDIDIQTKESNSQMISSILENMNKYYRAIDPDGNLHFDKLFTKNEENYSGSEGQEFYFSKLLAFNDYFKHQFPIIVDSYRSGEVSTTKELKMLDFYKDLNKQVILTSTLKESEYNTPNYDQYSDVNIIDYSGHRNSQILTEDYNDEFQKLLTSFNIYNTDDSDNVN